MFNLVFITILCTVVPAALSYLSFFGIDAAPAPRPDLTSQSSTLSPSAHISDLRMESSPSDDLGTYYVVPLTAPWRELPTDDDGGLCGQRQRKWLRENAHTLEESVLTTVRNAALSGPMISLTNLRVEDLKTSAAEPNLLFACGTAGMGDIVIANIDLANGGKVDVQLGDGSSARLPGSAFVFNLEPGEAGGILVHFRGMDKGYSGRLVATATVGTESRDVVIPLLSGPFDRAGVGASSAFVVSPREDLDSVKPFACFDAPDHAVPCDMADIEASLKRLWPGVIS